MDEEIGRGGMAVVYAGWHEQLERPVAMKVLAEHLADDPEFRARFLREARIASKLHHPNLVQTYDITEVDGLPCIVMELLPGGTLEGGALTREEAGEVAAGLAHAHSRGVVHRDLKPANLLRAQSGQVKVADFGIARALEETMVTQIGTVLGTMRYLSPEQAEGRVVGTEADVYSLGVVFDELLEGATGDDLMLIERMRSHDAWERPSTQEVTAAFGVTQVLPPPRTEHTRRLATRTEHTRRFATRTKLLAAGAAAAIVAALALAIGDSASKTPAHVKPVPHGATPAQQARNLSAWLKAYSR
jgi:serine/threonine protein kinase